MAYTRLNVTIPKETVDKLKKIAKKEKRSLSNMITYLIDKYEP
ncbi:MAG: ribbon-helix-helix protein, CopG family [Actinobacteria bacterium]|nr:ribbon-helix-helix protein, CopG family [Actinomycetota bacterium]MBE3120616.1 ribbon-helix-helix protein, CopG family [Thermoplasmata archaeon]